MVSLSDISGFSHVTDRVLRARFNSVKVTQRAVAGDRAKMLLTGATFCCYAPSMKLRDFLDQNEQTRPTFAAAIGVTDEAVRLWIEGARFPSRANLTRIAALTEGAVNANDFVEAA